MKIFDTRSNQYQELILDQKKTINIYECGPTVYDHIHLGNVRPLLIADIIINFLQYKKQKYNYLLNITDIDDKIIAKAKKEKKTEKEISAYFQKQFLDIYRRLNLNFPSKILKVTNHINNIKKDIQYLLDKNVAYFDDDNIYFQIDKFLLYNQISKNKLVNLRLIKARNKQLGKNNFDFALWKKTNVGQKWNFDNISGRPGWHLECASFIAHYFQETIDLHLGGVDLKFPHHENERAIFYFLKNHQEISRIFFHNGHVLLNKLKMSKSLQNCLYVKDFLCKYDANVIKYLFLLNSCLKPLNFNEEIFTFSQNEINKIQNLSNQIQLIPSLNWKKIITKNDNSYLQKFLGYLENNLNFPNCLMVLNQLIKEIKKNFQDKSYNSNLIDQFWMMLKLLGLKFK